MVLLLISSCRLANFGTAGSVCFFFFLVVVVVVGSLSLVRFLLIQPRRNLLASPTKGDAHRYTRDKGRHTSVSFPIWFVELLTLAPPFCSPTTTTRRRRENNFFSFSQNQKEITGGIIIGTTDLRAVARNVIQSWNYFNGIFFFLNSNERKNILYSIWYTSFLSVRLFYFFGHPFDPHRVEFFVFLLKTRFVLFVSNKYHKYESRLRERIGTGPTSLPPFKLLFITFPAGSFFNKRQKGKLVTHSSPKKIVVGIFWCCLHVNQVFSSSSSS